MLEPISSANAAQALAFLSDHPYEHAFLQWKIASASPRRRSSCFLSHAGNGTIDGVCYFGAQFVPAASGDAALASFSDLARLMPPEEIILGRRPHVERWWEFLRSWHRPPRTVRTSQPMYMVDRLSLRSSREQAEVGPATAEELDEIALGSAQTIEHENGISPDPTDPNFRARIAGAIRAKRWWRWRAQNGIRFQCCLGAKTPRTGQLQGVWTPPEHRRKAYALRALGAICDHLLDDLPTLSLYVNDFNTPAITLYERLGFKRVGELTTMLF